MRTQLLNLAVWFPYICFCTYIAWVFQPQRYWLLRVYCKSAKQIRLSCLLFSDLFHQLYWMNTKFLLSPGHLFVPLHSAWGILEYYWCGSASTYHFVFVGVFWVCLVFKKTFKNNIMCCIHAGIAASQWRQTSDPWQYELSFSLHYVIGSLDGFSTREEALLSEFR